MNKEPDMTKLTELLTRWDSGTDGDVLRRIAARVSIAPSGCWEAGFAKRGGYALIDVNCQTRQVHRVVYEAVNGPIPAGLQIDHLCRNRACCNPAHLEAVTPRINTLRGASFSAQHAIKTRCPRGHELTPENCLPHKLKLGRRDCRACHNARCRAARLAQRSVA